MEPSVIQEAVDAAVEAVFARRDEQSNLDRDTHAEHHQWLKERIATEKDKAEFWHAIRNKTIPWAIVALLGWAVSSVYALLGAYFTGHWK